MHCGECLATVWAVSYFRIQLKGRPFVLKTLMTNPQNGSCMTSEKLTRMHASFLKEYDMDRPVQVGSYTWGLRWALAEPATQ
jgi:hypothetical protein